MIEIVSGVGGAARNRTPSLIGNHTTGNNTNISKSTYKPITSLEMAQNEETLQKMIQKQISSGLKMYYK